MDFNIDFNLVRSQKLLLIPQLKQALEILEMSSQELFRHTEEQLEANPALEIALDDKTVNEYSDESQDAFQSEETTEIPSLKDHLLLQLKAVENDRLRSMVGEYLIDNTDENGYMNADIREVAAFFNISSNKVGKVLETLQKFDPPGICARNLKECLLLQLKQMDEIDPKAIYVVENHLEKLAAHDVQAISIILEISEDEANRIFDKIKSLEPKPGRQFYNREKTEAMVADVIIRTINGRLEALINDEAFPEVEISSGFSNPGQTSADEETSRYMQNCLNNAVWFIKCLEQRKNIIINIACRLVECLPEFFEKGAGYLKPMEADYFADRMDMHETVLQKALSGKYIQCRWGVYEMKRFVEI